MKPILFILLVILELQSCSSKMPIYTSEVTYLHKKEQGTITVKSTGYGKSHSEAIIDAQINTFKVILFKGLPGTELNIPLIENEKTATSEHPEYFQKFFDYNYYQSFIMLSTESSNLIKTKQGKKITVDLVINIKSLRIDLEQNQLIRKFGF
jgi:hypothetical protein